MCRKDGRKNDAFGFLKPERNSLVRLVKSNQIGIVKESEKCNDSVIYFPIDIIVLKIDRTKCNQFIDSNQSRIVITLYR